MCVYTYAKSFTLVSNLHKVLYVSENFAQGCAQGASRQIKQLDYVNYVPPDMTREKG